MKRYGKYKDSGIEWLGEIPEGWTVLKMKYLVQLITEKSQDASSKKIALENIESGTSKYIETESDFEGGGVAFKKDDILFGKLRPYLQKVWQASFDGQSVGDIYVFRVEKKYYPAFIKYVVFSDKFISIVNGSTYGAKMPRASWNLISQLKIAVPSYQEQVQISSFLDYSLGQVNNIIAEKEAMVKDLQAYRESVIFEAVTKGLDRNAKMKDSGIEWIGQMPENWRCYKLKYFATICSGKNIKADNISSEGRYEVYGGNGLIGFTEEKNTDAPSIIIGRVGALCGNVRLIKDDKWVTDNALILKLNENEYSYITYLLLAFNLNRLNESNAQPLITGTKVTNILLPIPPLSEQRSIADYLDTRTSQIDSLINDITKQIEDMKSYCQSLITEAVTGQIDLRNWKNPTL